MLNITNIPAPRVPFIDEKTGLISREWYRFLLNLFTLTGGGVNTTSLEDLQLVPPIEVSITSDSVELIPVAVPNFDDAYQQAQLIATVGQLQQTVNDLVNNLAVQPTIPSDMGSFLLLE
jgi:hypothetical protein